MSIKLKILIGFFLVLFIGALTMAASYPKIYSPYSFSVVIPAFMFYALSLPGFLLAILASLPNALLFLLSTRATANGKLKIGRLFTGISCLTIFLSIVFLIFSFDNGFQYQGLQHTLFMYLYNSIFISGIIATYVINQRRPSANNSLLFKVLFFCWLSWCAFPWLGELI